MRHEGAKCSCKRGRLRKGRKALTQVSKAACCGQEEASEGDLGPFFSLSCHRPMQHGVPKGSSQRPISQRTYSKRYSDPPHCSVVRKREMALVSEAACHRAWLCPLAPCL